jgi:hypothetical protein
VTPEVNLHRFLALEDSIFFDVISPDYDEKNVFLNYYEEKKRGRRPERIRTRDETLEEEGSLRDQSRITQLTYISMIYSSIL